MSGAGKRTMLIPQAAGGLARAKALAPERRQEIASRAAKARWSREPAEAKAPAGVDMRICVECGGARTGVVDCRPTARGFRRRRRCTDCGARWSTVEMPLYSTDAVTDVLGALDRTLAELGQLRDRLHDMLDGENDR